ncbi:MAG: N-acetylneuraminate synthase [Candidatus Omnitrophica bacterium]|nr:N-acetylneuraminate synthase [Candidatus Omnitrophota bacterium]
MLFPPEAMRKKIPKKKRFFSSDRPVWIIAEAGLNHNGDPAAARKLVDAAHAAGADAVKFQVFRPESLCSKESAHFALFSRLALNEDVWRDLARRAARKGIVFFASCFDRESVDLLNALGVPGFKIASGDLTHLPLIRYAASKKKFLIISTGMSLPAEIRAAVDTAKRGGASESVLLHCISHRPAKLEELNLRVIQWLERTFALPAGFSDHSEGLFAPVAAVCAGARVIEKHFTLDKDASGPDHRLSLDPEDFSEMVRMIRSTEVVLGEPQRRVYACEGERRTGSRRSLYAGKQIAKGKRLTRADIAILRPAKGILPGEFAKVVGKKARRTINAGEPLTWRDLDRSAQK